MFLQTGPRRNTIHTERKGGSGGRDGRCKGLQARAVWMSMASVAGAGQAKDDEATEAGRGRPCEGMKARGGEEVGVWILFSM